MSLLIKEMQSKAMSYLFTLIRMAKIMTDNNKCYRGCGEIGTFMPC